MWSEWRAPPRFHNHPGFVHPAILQDPTSWDKVMWETSQVNAEMAAAIYVTVLWKGIFSRARVEAWRLPNPWELKIYASEDHGMGWPLQLFRGWGETIYLPDGRFRPYSDRKYEFDDFWAPLWKFWWTSWRTQGKMRDHIPEFIQTVAEHTEMTELQFRDAREDLDMPVFPHLYIQYVIGRTIEHYVEQSRVKAPALNLSRGMFSDIAVVIEDAFRTDKHEYEPMFTRRQILQLRDVVLEKCNEVTYGIRAVDTIPADDVIFISEWNPPPPLPDPHSEVPWEWDPLLQGWVRQGLASAGLTGQF